MSREIKFRVWDKANNKFGHSDDYSIRGCGEYLQYECQDGEHDFSYDCFSSVSKDDLVFQQFTGLLDKNGVEIYEGDILSFLPERKGKTYVVEFWPEFGYVAKHAESSGVDSNGYEFTTSHFFSAFQWEHYHNVEYQYEVVGNIFQNPELLTK
jgi:uncharacterized phage protein (TIGR01671 family)